MTPTESFYLDDAVPALVILDQNLLPGEVKYLSLTTIGQVWDAIKELRVRGAPAIGVSAAMGLYIHMKRFASSDNPGAEAFFAELERAEAYLATARPTAVNLTWALNITVKACLSFKSNEISKILAHMKETVEGMKADEIAGNRKIGEYGAALLKPGMGVLTHCNAGALATSGYGTALGPIYCAHERGMPLRVYADETRPFLQGARLTAYELHAAGVDTTLICDNMAAVVMANGWVDVVFLGCDRIAANGDTANKVGTLNVAILAKRFGIPFYVCGPTSTIDPATPTGARIVIEQRDPREVTDMWYQKPMAPAGVKVFNPSFDVTPAELITGYITEKGILTPPFDGVNW
jgi:methylthioribose-1-phosphate isomerase